MFKLLNSFLQLSFAMLCLQLLSHGKSHRALVQGLVGGNCHFDFITHSQQEKPSLGLTQSYLTDDLIEALGKQFLTNRADAAFSSLALHELLVKHFS
jgi:hypothetical protein